MEELGGAYVGRCCAPTSGTFGGDFYSYSGFYSQLSH